ncbi:hypothetical protein SLEP1_g7013 [Rubroshorea leprosula]|uniref:ATP synthase F0 subunit 8 n=1 Tax=Rubroshorea leprosula TaxID=152421 RepID=A0AAV5I6U9_9ROSI|nr:hypothetical protein SLEP1_g7013 [Rubroshorea leprosula]
MEYLAKQLLLIFFLCISLSLCWLKLHIVMFKLIVCGHLYSDFTRARPLENF